MAVSPFGLAAVAMAKAVAAVKEVIPPNYVATTHKATANDYPEVGSTPARRSAEDRAMTRTPKSTRINTSPRGPQLAGAVSLRLPWCLWLLLSG